MHGQPISLLSVFGLAAFCTGAIWVCLLLRAHQAEIWTGAPVKERFSPFSRHMPLLLLIIFVGCTIFFSLLLRPQMPWDPRTQEQEWEVAGYVGHVSGMILYGYEFDETDATWYPISEDAYVDLSAPDVMVGYSDFQGSAQGVAISNELREPW